MLTLVIASSSPSHEAAISRGQNPTLLSFHSHTLAKVIVYGCRINRYNGGRQRSLLALTSGREMRKSRSEDDS
jgi:hypothetical protein